MKNTFLTKPFLTGVALFLFALAVFAGLMFADLNLRKKNESSSTGVSLHTELGGSADGYERACEPREIVFPHDHGAHPSFRNEWWYITGNLTTSDSLKFGFHVTFFRIANGDSNHTKVSNNQSRSLSAWDTSEFYMAHFAITREGSEQIRAHERFSRAAAGLAGAKVTLQQSQQHNQKQEPLVKVWLDDWQLAADEIEGELVWRVSLTEDGETIDLTLRAKKPIILQGKDGYSQKSSDPCNSSYYYSLTRLQATGNVSVDGINHQVTGSAWLDREWSSSALADDQVGWDWFALQLNDGREIMFYQLRKSDGTTDPYSHAVEIDQQGIKKELKQSEIKLEVTSWWQSETGAKYPVGGKIQLTDTSETLFYNPLIQNQELNLTVRYWEGAIVLTNESGDDIGQGYLELTGY